MGKITSREYWKLIRKNSKTNTNKILGGWVRVITIVIGVFAGTIKSLLSGGVLNTILYDLGLSFLIISCLWIIVWLSIFVYYLIHEPVVKHNEQVERISNLESRLNARASIIASKSQNIKSGNFVFEQIKLINSSSFDLYGCFVLVESFYEVKENGNVLIEPTSRNISWSTTGRRTPDNKVNLIKGIPENLYIVRVDSDENSYLMGEGGNNTLLEKEKSYFLQLRILGDNFSAHTMKISFVCNKDGSVNINEVSNPSYIDFFEINMSAGKMSINSQISSKTNWLKFFGFGKR